MLGFIKSAFPVSSKQIQENYVSDISPATIRNTMFDLEKEGYLSKPHTSAGRVPTDRGYRYYVDVISSYDCIQNGIRKVIERELMETSVDITLIMDKAAHLLGELSRELGVFIAPRFVRGILEKLELVSLSSNRLLVVLQIRSGPVKTVIMEMEFDVSDEKLPLITSILNERLCGLSLSDIIKTIDQRFSDLHENSIVRLMIDKAASVFDFSQPNIAKLSGTTNLMMKPEFQSTGKISQIVSQIENGTIIAHIFENRKDKPGIVITIGSENEDCVLADFSIITKDYRIGESKGLVAIIGPTRMNYNRTITLVDFVADFVTSIFKERRR